MEKHAKLPSGKAVKTWFKALKRYRPRGRGQWVSAAKVFGKGFVRPGRKAPLKRIYESLDDLSDPVLDRHFYKRTVRPTIIQNARQQLAEATGTAAGRAASVAGTVYGGKKGLEYVVPRLLQTTDTPPTPGLTTAADPSKPTLGSYLGAIGGATAIGGAGAFTLYELVKAIRATASKSRTGEKVDAGDKEEKSAQAPAPAPALAPVAPAVSPPKMVRTNLGVQELAAPQNRGVFIKGKRYGNGNLASLDPERPVYAPTVKPPLAYANSRRPRTNAEWQTAYARGEATPPTRAEYAAQMAAYNRRRAEEKREIDEYLRSPMDWSEETPAQIDQRARYVSSQLRPVDEGGWGRAAELEDRRLVKWRERRERLEQLERLANRASREDGRGVEKTSEAWQYPGWIERIFPRLKQNRLADEKIKTLERLYPDKKAKPVVPWYAGKVTTVAKPRVSWTGKLAR